MRVSEKAKLVYINPPRTGTTLIHRVMHEFFDDVWYPKKGTWHNTVWNSNWQDYFIFISVRNPYTRAVSIWQRQTQYWKYRKDCWKKWLNNGKISFEDLILHPSEKVQNWWQWQVCSSFTKPIPRIDHVVHLEQLQEDLEKVPGLKKEKYECVNPSRYLKAWQANYQSEQCISAVKRIFQPDFESYGYSDTFSQYL
jgi:hypothetical protein